MKTALRSSPATKPPHEPDLSQVQADVLAGLARGGRLEVPTSGDRKTLYAEGDTREVKQVTFARLENLHAIAQTEQHADVSTYRITILGMHLLDLHRAKKKRGGYLSPFAQGQRALHADYTRWQRWIQLLNLASRYATQAPTGAEFLRRVRLIRRAEAQAQRASDTYQHHCEYHGAILRDLVADCATKIVPGQPWQQLPTIVLMRNARKLERSIRRSGGGLSVCPQASLLQLREELSRRADWEPLQREQEHWKASIREIHQFFERADEQ